MSTSAWMLTGVQQYPDRFITCPNFGPIIQRGVKEAIHEMEFIAKEYGVKVFKFHCPEDTYINDKRLWPIFAKAQELNLVMQVHTGTGYVYGARNKYCHPGLLEDVLYDFYDLRPEHGETSRDRAEEAGAEAGLSGQEQVVLTKFGRRAGRGALPGLRARLHHLQ